MSSGMPELGSKISLISKADIRYEGRLFTVDPNECTIALANVRSFGTEDRETQYPIAPQSQIYDYILFRGTDIKDIRVVNNGMPHPNDPAIMQMQLPNGQHLMPHFPLPTMNPPMGGFSNPFGAINNLGGLGTTAPAGLAPGSFMLAGGTGSTTAGNVVGGGGGAQKPKQQSELNDTIPDHTSGSNLGAQNAPPTGTVEHKDQDLLTGASRSTTPVSLVSRKSPSADMAVQANQNAVGTSNSGNTGVVGGHRLDGGMRHKQNHQMQQRYGGSGGNSGRGGGGGGSGGGGGDNQRNDMNRIRRDSGRMQPQHDNRNNYQRNNMQNRTNNRGWVNRNNNMTMMNMSHMRNMNNRTRGRMQNQLGGYRQPGNPNKTGRPKNTIKFDQDYDFEQANSKFEELRSQLSKLKVGEDAKTEQVNGEVEKKDDSGNETGAGEHEQEEEEVVVGYDKSKSFFDNISCEAAADRTKSKNRTDWRQERKLNSETFGISSTRRNNYRGRGGSSGGYYNRNMMMNSHGGYNNRGYRPGNYRPRNMNNRSTGLPNNKTIQNQQSQQQQQQQPQNQSEQQPQQQKQQQSSQQNQSQGQQQQNQQQSSTSNANTSTAVVVAAGK